MTGRLRELAVRVDRASRAAVRGRARYVFPDHWTFLLGEIALYCFVVLVVTGMYLALFFDPALATDDLPRRLRAARRRADVAAPTARPSTSRSTVAAGLLVRQTHHWAALVFVAAIMLHLLRVFFTGAFRKPRELNWLPRR